ncbi:MAG: CRISPR-associated helicase Cas3' [Alphaproteobacteria bacterium]|nr:MAG: CRISPR-associated helicase Cas3' [Alphaproteobacteria bacterium]
MLNIVADLRSDSVFAHSVDGNPEHDWEPLTDHLCAVGTSASCFALPFGAAEVARAAGLLHDLGKAKPAFQAYLRGNRPSEPHSGEGARFAAERFGGLGKLISYAIAGHHAGLPNGTGRAQGRPATPLHDRIRQAEALELPRGIELPALEGPPAPLAGLAMDDQANFRLHFFTRMLFSALVDADFLETEAFYDRVEGRPRERGWSGSLEELRRALDAHLAAFGQATTPINAERARILSHVRAGAKRAPGLFSLTVPTGGGKTLTSLAFALDHAIAHGLTRVIHVIPYVSIIEQTAAVFRNALGDADAVLEHHASFDWEGLDDPAESERLRLAAQNWDRPVTVTTAVQFFESLFANRPSKCRKLHRLAKSVIILDEAQMLPLRLLRPCLAALKELARGYGASVVFCTATQPALKTGARGDGFPAPEGLDPAEVTELAPDPPRLYEAFRRVRVQDAGEMDDQSLADELRRRDQVLAILNNRRHARTLFDMLDGAEGGAILTTWMTPAHRRSVLDEVRWRLEDGRPVRIVATSLIEAGVDVDFPVVWREAAGIDSIAQAAGRCNREGRRESGEVFVFRSNADFPPPAELRQFAEIGQQVLARHGDPLSLAAVRDYFRDLFWRRGVEALDAAEVGGRHGIMTALAEAGNQLDFPFADIAAAFRLIEDGALPLVIRGGRWGVPPDEMERLRHVPHAGAVARAFQPYQVSVAPRLRAELIGLGAASWWREGEFGPQFAVLENPRLYDERAGFSPEDPEDMGGMIW